MANLHNNISDGRNFTAEDAGNTFGVDGGIAFGGSTNSADEKGQTSDGCKSLGGGKSVDGRFAKTTDGREKVGEGANVDGGLANTTDGREGMYCYKYPHPALTVDCVIFGFDGDKLNVLLVERGLEPYKGMWALPGGFVNIDETVEDAARRELMEETGIADMFLEQFRVFSAVHRDPRERVVTVAFLTLVSQDKCGKPRAGTDASLALWFDESKLPPLAFDHREIIDKARHHLSDIIRLRPVAFRLLNKVFTVAELQRVYEIINRTQYDRRNFQRKLLQSDILDDRGIAETKMASRPPRMYSLKPEIEKEVAGAEETGDLYEEPDCAIGSRSDKCCSNSDICYSMAGPCAAPSPIRESRRMSSPSEYDADDMDCSICSDPADDNADEKGKRGKKDDGFSLRRLFEW